MRIEAYMPTLIRIYTYMSWHSIVGNKSSGTRTHVHSHDRAIASFVAAHTEITDNIEDILYNLEDDRRLHVVRAYR